LNGKFDPENKLFQFVNRNIKKLTIEEFLEALNKEGFPIHGFHKDKNGIVKNNLCDVLMFAENIDFSKEFLKKIDVFFYFQSISHFGHHLHQIKIHKIVPGYRCSKDYPITDIIFLLLNHVKENDLIIKFDTGDMNGNTPFMIFVKQFSDTEIIKKFVSMGSNIHHINKYGENILHLLARKKNGK
jgi:ankyrin repeat protein